MLAVMTLLLGGAVVLFAFGQALGSKGRHQRAVDLAAVSAAQVMRDLYPRLFEPPLLENGLPNPRHLPLPVYLALARRAAVRGARRNGVSVRGADVSFPAGGFAPTRVAVRVRGVVRVRTRLRGRRGARGTPVPVRARAAAEITPALGAQWGMPAFGSGGGYDGPLAYRMGKPMRPDVAAAFDRMAAAARKEAGLFLSINSAFRSDAEQARLFAANPNPKWVAPPGTSLHRYATELDLGPSAAYPWLASNARRFGFIHRYRWEAWH
jgi:D-alanyl-D-alanine carboxypeptidase